MFMFHRILNLVTMMYNEAEELTVCHFMRDSDKKKVRRQQEEERSVQQQIDEMDAKREDTERRASESRGAGEGTAMAESGV